MKREIVLLRHAHAENLRPDQDDVDRALSPRGVAEAEAAGAWLREHHALPAQILCSPAVRAKQTLQHALGSPGMIKVEPQIYEATAGELMSVIDEHAETERLLLVGHNPGFETLVALLTTGQSGDFRGVPPGGVVWIELDGAAEPAEGRLKAFWSP